MCNLSKNTLKFKNSNHLVKSQKILNSIAEMFDIFLKTAKFTE